MIEYKGYHYYIIDAKILGRSAGLNLQHLAKGRRYVEDCGPGVVVVRGPQVGT
jgi:hypothetical protein